MTLESVLEPETSPIVPAAIAAVWVDKFADAVSGNTVGDPTALFTEGATWHDFMSFSWDITNRVGRDDMATGLQAMLAQARPYNFRLSAEQPPVLSDGAVLVFFEFDTEHRVNRAHARLEGGDWLCSILSTQAHDFSEHPAAIGRNRVQGKVHGYVKDRARWSAARAAERDFRTTQPPVVILGAGHNGLSLAAYFKAFGIDALVIDRNERVGDNWRKRYSSLALHSLMNADHLAYYPFPQTWTEHTPKDKFADHLESYVSALDLNVWTGTEVLDAAYDDTSKEWAISIRTADGEDRTLRPRHYVIAAGLNGTPKIPDIADIEKFQGETVHSGEFQGGADYEGKKVLVVGSGVSGHEILQDLYEHGAGVTLLQRGGTYVINFKTFTDIWYSVFQPDAGLSTDYADMVFHAMPLQTTWELNKMLVNMAKEVDKPLLDKLESQGFKLDWGPDGTGIIGNHLFLGRDSYQINCGASELIADGRVPVRQGVEVARATERGVVLTDGTELEADLIVFATGYHDMLETMRPLLGAAGEKVQKVYGLAQDGEYSECWRRSRQPGLYFATGFVATPRHYGRYLALLIKAMELGLTPIEVEDR